MKGLFITGTDTGAGKTYVTCALVAAAKREGLRVGAYKPVCSGAVVGPDGKPRWSDVEALWTALDGEYPSELIGPQCFQAPLAPPQAAEEEGRRVDRAKLFQGVEAWRGKVDLLLIEGAGGLFCPLTESTTMADWAGELGAPLVVVAANRLGVISHTLLTLECAVGRGLSVAAVVLNDVTATGDESRQRNLGAIRKFAPAVRTVELHAGETEIRGVNGPLSGRDWLRLAGDFPAR